MKSRCGWTFPLITLGFENESRTTAVLKEVGDDMSKLKVAFICVHNSCRSQIAEALGKHLTKNGFDSYSAGTEVKDKINPDAVRLMKKHYDIDMEATQRPKLLDEIPTVDYVITMGCNVQCPNLPCKHREDWGLDDPTGKSDEEFLKVIAEIEMKIKDLIGRIGDNTDMIPCKGCPGINTCPCPKIHCRNRTNCCACISFHRTQEENDYLPYCLFPHDDKSMEAVYQKLKEKFEA